MSEWYLRKVEGHIYGPVNAVTLWRWAADGRIAPDDSISQDQDAWMTAHTVADLAMDWRVLLADQQEYGPVHLLALRDLLREGVVTLDTRVQHKENGDNFSVAEALLPVLVEQNDRMQEEIDKLTGRIGELQHHIKEQQHLLMKDNPQAGAESDPVVREWREVLEHRESLQKDMLKWKKLYEEERASRDHARNEAEAQNRALKQSLAEMQSERDKLLYRTRQLEKHMQELQAAQGAEDGSGLPPATTALFDSYQKLSENYDGLLQQLTEKSEELRVLLDAREETEQRAEQRIRQMEDVLTREREEADKARRRLAEIERTHLQLVKSYRELNDQYIRIRQGQELPHRSEEIDDESTPDTDAPPNGGPRVHKDWKPRVKLT